ncbi:MAG: acyl-CoA dehydrogenase family protein, partial [Schleiferiaceae bacterium]
MNYPIEAQHSEELELIRSAAAEFAAQRIAPRVMEWDEAQIFPKELFHEMGKLGFLGVLVSPEYGGAGMGYAEYITIVDEIAQVCGSIGLSVAAH